MRRILARALPAVLLCGAAGAAAQDPPPEDLVPFQTSPGFTVKSTTKRLAAIGFHCQEEKPERRPTPTDKLLACSATTKAQSYGATILADAQDRVLSLSVHANRRADGTLSVPDVLRVLTRAADQRFAGAATGDEIAFWLRAHVERPLLDANSRESRENPETGEVDLAPAFENGTFVLTVVGMPSAPGFDMTVKGF